MIEEEDMLDAIKAEDAAPATELALPAVQAPPAVNLAGMLPKTGGDLFALAKQISASGLFDPVGSKLTPQQAFAIMLEGAYYGVTPFTALKNITLIKGKPTPSAVLVAALITRDPRVTRWEVVATPELCTITAERSDRKGVIVEQTRIEDVPAHLKKPSSRTGEASNYVKYAADMLFAFTCRRIARRNFADVLTGLSVPEHEPRDIADVAGAAERTGTSASAPCPKCGDLMWLRANPLGGALMECKKCSHREPPPQAIRDEIRGYKDAFDNGEVRTTVVDVTPTPPAVMADDDEPGMTATERLRAARIAELRKEVAEMLVSVPLDARNRFLDAFGAPGGEERTVWFREIDDEDVLIALRDGFASYREHEEGSS